MKINSMTHLIDISLLGAAPAFAADTYTIDLTHTYPNFQADHMCISVWRGKFTKSSGEITLDPAAKSGSMTIKIDAASMNFGNEALNKRTKAAIFSIPRNSPKPYIKAHRSNSTTTNPSRWMASSHCRA